MDEELAEVAAAGGPTDAENREYFDRAVRAVAEMKAALRASPESFGKP